MTQNTTCAGMYRLIYQNILILPNSNNYSIDDNYVSHHQVGGAYCWAMTRFGTSTMPPSWLRRYTVAPPSSQWTLALTTKTLQTISLR